MATKNIVPRGNNEGQLGTESKKWNKHIATTGSFDYISGSLRSEDVLNSLPSNLISSSAQLSTRISGSFTSVSSSFSTRVTTVESELENTLISASAQLADEISGSFNNGFEFNGTISGSATSTGSFGRVESTSISITSTGSFGRIEATSISASLVEVDADTLRVGGEPMNKTLLQNIKRAHSSTIASPVGKHNLSGDISGSITSTGSFGQLLVKGAETSGTNTGDVTIASGRDYIAVSNQELTLGQVDLTTDVTGVLPSANLDADTAHLSGTQTFSGAKTFSSALTTAAINSSGDITTTGDITAQNFIVSSSVTNLQIATLSGSTEFGDDITDTHLFTGSLFVSGNLDAVNLTSDSGSFSTRVTSLESNGVFTSAGISGSFIAPSASFSTRLTVAESELSNTLISSSAQISTEISGAFTSNSASFSTRLTTEEGNIDTLQARRVLAGDGLTGGGDLTADRTFAVGAGTGVTVNSGDVAIGQDIGTTSKPLFAAISSSGDISGSSTSTGSFGAVVTPTYGRTISNITEIIEVTVVDDGGNHYAFEGATTPNLVVSEGKTYRFDQSDSTNDTHPFRFSLTEDGSTYSTGVTTVGTPGEGGAYTEIKVTKATANRLFYKCTAHSGMGNQGNILKNDLTNFGGNISGSAISTGSFGHILVDGTNIETFISSSASTFGFSGGGTSDYETLDNIPEDIISGSSQIATAISGAFANTSSSLASRITLAESELGNTLISSSAQIATNISGAFANGFEFDGTISGSVTSTGSYGRVVATKFVGDGSGLTGLSSAAIATYNTSGDNRIITSVNSSTVQGEANLSFDGTILSSSLASTASFGHYIVGGNNFTTAVSESAAASGFGSGGGAGGGDMSDLVDDTSPQLGGDLDLNSNDITGTGNITISGNISGSSTSTGSFERVHIIDKLGIGTKTPFNNLHIVTSGDNIAKFKSSDATARIILEDNNSENNGNYIEVKNDVMTLATNGGNDGLVIGTNQSITASGDFSSSLASTGSFGHLMVGGNNFTTAVSSSAASAGFGGGSGGSQNVFSTVAVAGQSNVVADATTDTLTLVAGDNMTITTNAGSDSVTFASSGEGGSGGASTSRSTTRSVATANQTTFNVNYTASLLDVYQNGIKLDSSEVTATNGTSVVLSSGATVNDVLEFVAFSTISTGTHLNITGDTATTSSLFPMFTSDPNFTSGNLVSASINTDDLSFTPSTGKLYVDGGVSGSANSTASFGQILLGGEELSAGGGGGILATQGTDYSDGGVDASYTLTTSYVAFDSTYYRVAFTAPASGKVLLHAQVTVDPSSSSRTVSFKWDVQGASPSTSYADFYYNYDESDHNTVHPERIITGLTPGQSYTYDLFARTSSTTVYLKWGQEWCAPLAYALELP